ncbi:GNAT family protein [Variovorax sp. J22R133]|uniref:GNAT family N-acetyltransferase n=1 Tax=Variovorax brevis TaxID=3053503 RepID=UPI0025783E79|nr:GNAT family protein [Variovorax sp. J22R133]MDM0110732.1 GNAT family protein [Variovorax sp. J22R133]
MRIAVVSEIGLMKNRRSLVGSRTKLVALERHHLSRRVEFINDVAVQETLNFDYPTSVAKTEAWFARTLLDRARVDFALEDVKTSEIIGFCGLLGIDRSVRKAELYIFVGNKVYWGQGFGRDGYKLLVNYGFSELGLQRIYLYQLADNLRAVTATAALGWVNEGLLRKNIYSHGLFKDQLILSLLRSEWEGLDFYDEI